MESRKKFREAYEAVENEIEDLLKEQEQIEEKLLSRRKALNALATLIRQSEGEGGDKLRNLAAAAIRYIAESTITDDILRVINSAKTPLTASDIRKELEEIGDRLAKHKNPLATIHAILGRLTESDRAHETVKDGKKAWERMNRMPEAFGKASNDRMSDRLKPRF